MACIEYMAGASAGMAYYYYLEYYRVDTTSSSCCCWSKKSTNRNNTWLTLQDLNSLHEGKDAVRLRIQFLIFFLF